MPAHVADALQQREFNGPTTSAHPCLRLHAFPPAAMPPKKAAILASATKSNKKKKWSKGKVKDKATNAVVLDRPLYDRILKEVPTFKMISQSTLVDRLKINGSLARVAIKHLEREGQIKRIIHHHSQLVYTRTSGE